MITQKDASFRKHLNQFPYCVSNKGTNKLAKSCEMVLHQKSLIPKTFFAAIPFPLFPRSSSASPAPLRQPQTMLLWRGWGICATRSPQTIQMWGWMQRARVEDCQQCGAWPELKLADATKPAGSRTATATASLSVWRLFCIHPPSSFRFIFFVGFGEKFAILQASTAWK